MSKYRIAPFEVDRWKIQRKWLWLFWVDVLNLVGQDTYEVVSFADKDRAKAFIDGRLEVTETHYRDRSMAAIRRAQEVPEEYP